MKDILLRYSLFILYWKIFSRDIYVYMLPNLAIYCIVISLGAYNSECIHLGNINVTVLGGVCLFYLMLNRTFFELNAE